MKKTAIALQYPKNAAAPLIAYKGSGTRAEQMLTIAKEHDVPVVVESDTAVILSAYNIGECVPVETYEILAGIFAFLKKVEAYDNN